MAGFEVYSPLNPTKVYMFDKSVGRGNEEIGFVHNHNRMELRTFGKRPYVYYAGHTDYLNIELTTVFFPEDCDIRNAYVQANEFIALVKTRKPLIVENSEMNLKILCDVELVGDNRPKLYQKGDFDYVSVTIRCTEIGQV